MQEEQEHRIAAFLQGKLSPDDRRAFEEWRNASQENKDLVEQYRHVWELTKGGSVPEHFESEHEWKLIESAIQVDNPRIRKQFLVAQWSRIAAALVMFVMAFVFIFLRFFDAHQQVVETAANTRQVELPDGSKVWMNQHSRISYSKEFDDRRSLQLEGEAFFEITHNPARPFSIDTEGAIITVLGTSFNVQAYANEPETEVMVVTGSVRMTAAKANELVLNPGTVGILKKTSKELTQEAATDESSIAWKSRKFGFRSTPLGRVVKTLRSYFHKDIKVANEKLLACRITAAFEGPTFDEVMEVLSQTLDLDVKVSGDTYIIDGVGCD